MEAREDHIFPGTLESLQGRRMRKKAPVTPSGLGLCALNSNGYYNPEYCRIARLTWLFV